MSSRTYRKQNLSDLLTQMPGASASFISSQISRRSLIGGAAGLAGLGLAGAGLASPAPSSTRRASAQDAAPPEEQVFRQASNPAIAITMDFYERVYERAGGADMFSQSLVFLTKDAEIVPGGATEWSSDETGKVWTFKLRDDLMWSDGNKVTAADFIKTFQYAADPEHAWDFAWFWDGDIVNFSECLAGDVPLEELGVRQGANEFELIVETVNSAPYLPGKMLYSNPLSKAALETHGPLYNSNPETCVSSGPFILSEWVKDQYLINIRNEAYSGPWEVPLQKIIVKFADPAQTFTLYEADQIDYMQDPAPAELQIMQADPETEKEIYQGVGDFACLYFFFDVTTAPFDNKLVRQAFSHVIDRDAMKQQIWGPQANAAPSFLAPGFPASNTEELADIQAFNPELGKQLLAEAGYPDGEGFPELVMTVRGGGSPLEVATTQAYGTMLSQHLNINVELQTMDRNSFYADMKTIQFGWVSYGMDFFDPSNMLGVWKTGGRHPWTNEEYDRLYDEASVFLGDPEERLNMFKEAERILVEDVPAVFTYFQTPIQLFKPYVVGAAIEPDVNGIASLHFPGFLGGANSNLQTIFISADAPTGRE
jgi:peptide/nickel transport system substrate-binding protein/oligopeptide transport system substrate-binding protein